MDDTNWLLDMSKIEDNHTWILKLIASSPETLSVLANHNIDLNVIDAFVVSDDFYKDVSNTRSKILSVLSSDPMTIVASLLKLKEKFNSDTLYLTDFLSKLDMESFRGYLKGSEIENKTFLLDNVGFTTNIYTNYETYDKKIDSYIKKVKGLENLPNTTSKTLKISSKSSIEWRKVDLLKHALGTPGDMIKLSLSLLEYNKDTSQNKKIKPLSFLVDIFSVYFNNKDKDFSALLEENFYSNTSIKIPTWKSGDDSITNLVINNLDNNSKKETSLSHLLNKYLLEYENYKKSGVTETLVLIVYNMLYSLVYRFKFMYNGFKVLLDKSNKFKIRERKVIESSVKKAIDSFEMLIKKQVRDFFGLDTKYAKYGIEKISDLELYPKEKKVGTSGMFRVMGGIESIKYKEKCNKNLYPIVLEYDADGNFNGKVDNDATMERMVKLLLNTTDEYVGGIVMARNISIRTFDIIKIYLNDVIDAKRKGMIKIDNYFNKMISGIKLQKASGIAKELQSIYTKIISEKDKLIKKVLIQETVSNIGNHYKNLRDLEYEKLKDYIEVYQTVDEYSERNENNNKILNTKDGRNKLKRLAHIQKKLLLEYFVAKNTAYVYKLLANSVLESLQITIETKTNKNNILPNSIKNSLNNKIAKINEKANNNINKLNHNLNLQSLQNRNINGGYKKFIGGMNHQHAIRPFNTLKKNKKPRELEKIYNKQYWLDLDYQRLGGKKIFIPFYNNRSLITPTGYFNILYGPREGKLDIRNKFIKKNSSKSICKIRRSGLIIVCNKTSEITDPKKWRHLNREFLLDIEHGGISNIREKIYNIIASNTDYLRSTDVWHNNSSKALLYNICKNFGLNMLKCQIIISREELSKQLHISTHVK